MWTKIHDSAVGLNVWRKWHTCKTKKTIILLKVIKFCHNGSNNKIRITNWLRKLSRVTKIIQSTEKNRSLWNRQIRDSTTKIETSFPWKILTQISQVLCKKYTYNCKIKDHSQTKWFIKTIFFLVCQIVFQI
jgi:hypothetical protein